MSERWEMVLCEDGAPMVATGGDVVCVAEPNHEQPDEFDLRNFRLIAAAPDLYAAAEKALNYIANTEGEFGVTLNSGDALRAALAKARGEKALAQ